MTKHINPFFPLLISLIFGQFLAYQNSFSQGNFTLYSLDNTPQANYVNPGFKQMNRLYVSLPMGMQSFAGINSGFKINDILQKRVQDDSLDLTPSLAVAKMAKSNFLNVDSYNELLGVGFRMKKNYLSFNVSNRLQARFSYPKDLFKIAVEGNGKELLGQRASLSGLGLDALSYIEYGVGFNRDINSKLTVGGRLKFLSGVANVQTKKSELGLYTDPTTFDITVDGEMMINSSNVAQLMDSSFSPMDMLSSTFNFKNRGVGVDLGASYQLNDKIRLTTSLLDFGYIKWNNDVTNYSTNNVNYSFKGVDLNAVLFDSVNIASSLMDTLNSTFKLQETNNAYNTGLRTRFYVGANYSINKYFTGGVLMYNEFVASKYTAGFSLSSTVKVKNWLSASLNYSVYGRSFNNIGFGLNLKGGPLQFYVMADNVLAFLNPSNAKYVHLSTGINIVIGPRKDKDGDGIVDKKDRCPDVAGDIYFKGCPDRDNDSIIDLEDECPDIAGLLKFKGCPDRDNDSIIDSKDDCPDVAGIALFNGCPDTDGDGIKDSEDECPDLAGSVENLGCPDTDLDGVIDQIDNCPTESGPKENNGCPWPDTDLDGLLDKDDLCPTIKGTIENQGCPDTDTDGDGVIDKEDECPTLAGIVENHGCPKIEVEEQEILKTAFDAMEFNTGNAVIKDVSYPSLDELAKLLTKKQEWKLKISGHTDNVGNDQSNMVLSKKRSEAIKAYLEGKGVESSRIITLFFGESVPIASNDTEEGRQKNRRVELKIVFE
jgi:outer membrane protein OmpA-like peptidoglycan-associated protein